MERNLALAPRRPWIAPTLSVGAAMLLGLIALSGALGALSVVSCLTGVVATMLLLLPIPNAIFLYFLYLMMDGAIKVNSNYHPVLHVAQDLLLITLIARSCWEPGAGGFAKFGKTPQFGILLTLLVWIGIQFANPFGLGVLPSVAGTKVYLSMLALFFLVYHHIPREDGPKLLRWLLIVASIEGALAVIEYLYGQKWMLALHPRYREMIRLQFGGIFYRPFGTTAVPGGPAVWVMLGAPIAGYFVERAPRRAWDLALAAGYLAIAGPALIFCQVRVAILTAAAGFIFTMLRPSRGLAIRIVATGAIGAAFAVAVTLWFNTNTTPNFRWVAGLSAAQREMLLQRTLSLGSRETYLHARDGSWDESLALADQTWLGIGLSRVGAASEVWENRIAADPYFGPRWSFADNLYKAIFTELGIFGLFAWMLYVGALLKTLFGSLRRPSAGADRSLIWMSASFASLLLLTGVGNEGILYNPVSGIFWTFLALGMKEASYVRNT